MFCPKCATENPDNSKFCRSCGANLSNVLAVVDGQQLEITPITVETADLYSTGVRNVILGMGFLLASIFLKLIPPTDGILWLLFLIPAFCLVASGVSRILKYESLTKGKDKKTTIIQENAFPINQANKELPPTMTNFVNSKFQTNELVERPASVTESTTKLLNKEIIE